MEASKLKFMTTVPLEEAKERLEELLEVAATGETIVIIKDDGSAFELVAQGQKRPGYGSAKGWFTLAEDFDDPLEDFAEYME